MAKVRWSTFSDNLKASSICLWDIKRVISSYRLLPSGALLSGMGHRQRLRHCKLVLVSRSYKTLRPCLKSQLARFCFMSIWYARHALPIFSFNKILVLVTVCCQQISFTHFPIQRDKGGPKLQVCTFIKFMPFRVLFRWTNQMIQDYKLGLFDHYLGKLWSSLWHPAGSSEFVGESTLHPGLSMSPLQFICSAFHRHYWFLSLITAHWTLLSLSWEKQIWNG